MHAKFGQYSACLIVRRVSAGHAESFLQPPGFGENTKDDFFIPDKKSGVSSRVIPQIAF